MLDDIREEEARSVVQRLLQSFRGLGVDHQDGPIAVRCSVGFAQTVAGDNPGTLLAKADDALLRAKREGRDRAVASSGWSSADGEKPEDSSHLA